MPRRGASTPERSRRRAVALVGALATSPLACNLLIGNQDVSAADGGLDSTVDRVESDAMPPDDRAVDSRGPSDADASPLDAAKDALTDADATCSVASGIQGMSQFCLLYIDASGAPTLCADFDTDAALDDTWAYVTRARDAGTVAISSNESLSPPQALFAQSPSMASGTQGWLDFVQTGFDTSTSASLDFDLYIELQSKVTMDFATVAAIGFGSTIDGGNPHVAIGLAGGFLKVMVYNAAGHANSALIKTAATTREWTHLSLQVDLTGPEAGASLAVMGCPSSPPAVFETIVGVPGFPTKSTSGFMAIGLPFVSSTTNNAWAVYVDNVVFNAH